MNDKETREETAKEEKKTGEEAFTKEQVEFLLRQQEEQIRRAKEEEERAKEKSEGNRFDDNSSNLVRHLQADEINIDSSFRNTRDDSFPMKDLTQNFMETFKANIESDGMLDKSQFTKDQVEFGGIGLVIEDYVTKFPELAENEDIKDFMNSNWKGICERYLKRERFTYEGLVKTNMFDEEDLKNIDLRNDARYVRISKELGRRY